MTKKIVVTGATGQDGSYMIEYLLANTDNTVIAAIRRTSQAILGNLKGVIDNPRVKLVTLDLNDVHSISTLIRDEKPDFFINLGASAFVPDSWNSPAQVMQTNAVSLIHILEAVRQYAPQCRTYNAGSSEEFGDVLYSPQDEKHPARPRSVYGVSKATGRMICKVYRESYGLYVVQGLLFNHESERRQEHYVTRKITKGVARIARAIKDDKPFESLELGNLDAKRDWSHAVDFVDGIWRMLNQEQHSESVSRYVLDRWRPDAGDNDTTPERLYPQCIKEYILSSGETHTVREFVERAFAVAGIRGAWWNGHFKKEPPEDECFIGLDPAIDSSGADVGMYNMSRVLVRINPAFYRPAEVSLLHGDSTAARRELGWAPKVTFDELVTRMVKNDLAEVGL